LAKTSVMENAIDSIVEAEIVIPTEDDERAEALSKATSTSSADFMFAAACVLLAIGFVLYVLDLDVLFETRSEGTDHGARMETEL
jgi:hypothetical protein